MYLLPLSANLSCTDIEVSLQRSNRWGETETEDSLLTNCLAKISHFCPFDNYLFFLHLFVCLIGVLYGILRGAPDLKGMGALASHVAAVVVGQQGTRLRVNDAARLAESFEWDLARSRLGSDQKSSLWFSWVFIF